MLGEICKSLPSVVDHSISNMDKAAEHVHGYRSLHTDKQTDMRQDMERQRGGEKV